MIHPRAFLVFCASMAVVAVSARAEAQCTVNFNDTTGLMNTGTNPYQFACGGFANSPYYHQACGAFSIRTWPAAGSSILMQYERVLNSPCFMWLNSNLCAGEIVNGQCTALYYTLENRTFGTHGAGDVACISRSDGLPFGIGNFAVIGNSARVSYQVNYATWYVWDPLPAGYWTFNGSNLTQFCVAAGAGSGSGGGILDAIDFN